MTQIHSHFMAIPETYGKYQIVLVKDFWSSQGELMQSVIVKKYQVYDVPAEAFAIDVLNPLPGQGRLL